MSSIFLWVIVILLMVTSMGVLLARSWRWIIIHLAIQYIGVFILTLQNWTLGMATVKVIAGWMSAAILGITQSNLPDEQETESSTLPQGRVFRAIAGLIVIVIALNGAPIAHSMMADAGVAVSAGSLLLIGMGLLHLGITDRILRVIIGLMTVLSGFEILYAAVESSLLVAALLALINLGLALAGSYLIIAYHAKETEPS